MGFFKKKKKYVHFYFTLLENYSNKINITLFKHLIFNLDNFGYHLFLKHQNDLSHLVIVYKL